MLHFTSPCVRMKVFIYSNRPHQHVWIASILQHGPMILYRSIVSFVTVARATSTWWLLLFQAPVFSLQTSAATHSINMITVLYGHDVEPVLILPFQRSASCNVAVWTDSDAAHPPPSVTAWVALKWPSCAHAVPAQLSLVHVPFPSSLPRCTTSAAAPGRRKHNLTAWVHLYVAVAMQAACRSWWHYNVVHDEESLNTVKTLIQWWKRRLAIRRRLCGLWKTGMDNFWTVTNQVINDLWNNCQNNR